MLVLSSIPTALNHDWTSSTAWCTTTMIPKRQLSGSAFIMKILSKAMRMNILRCYFVKQNKTNVQNLFFNLPEWFWTIPRLLINSHYIVCPIVNISHPNFHDIKIIIKALEGRANIFLLLNFVLKIQPSSFVKTNGIVQCSYLSRSGPGVTFDLLFNGRCSRIFAVDWTNISNCAKVSCMLWHISKIPRTSLIIIIFSPINNQ